MTQGESHRTAALLREPMKYEDSFGNRSLEDVKLGMTPVLLKAYCLHGEEKIHLVAVVTVKGGSIPSQVTVDSEQFR